MLDVLDWVKKRIICLRPLARSSGKSKPLCTNRIASPPRPVSEPLAFRGLRAKEFPIPLVQMGHYPVSRGACLR
jgi:hypothetical protein